MTNEETIIDQAPGPVRIYIATTAGPVHIQRITQEDPDVSSVVCLGGKAVALPISIAYDAFVRDPTGVIQRCFGHGAYRVDVSATVDEGYSWQLALYVAHAAAASVGLASEDDETAPGYIVTGEVDRDLNVLAVDHVAAKFAAIPIGDPRFTDAMVILPEANRNDGDNEIGCSIEIVDTVAEALAITGLEVASSEPVEADPIWSEVVGVSSAPPRNSEVPKRHTGLWLSAVLILLITGAGLAAFTGPVPGWFGLYERGRVADLHRDLKQSQDPRAGIAETILKTLSPNSDQLMLRVEGTGAGMIFRAEGPDDIYLSGRGMRWIGSVDNVSRPDHVVYLDARPGRLDWQPERASVSNPVKDKKTDAEASKSETVYRLIVLASPRPISGPQPWFPALGGLGLPGRDGSRAARVRARLNSVGIAVKALEHRVPGR